MVEGEATMAGGAAARVDVDFIGVGCNRVVGTLAWGPCNLVAFAAHHSVAIFDPKLARVLTTLQGHKDFVNCVEWVPKHACIKSGESSTEEKFLLSGSADGGIFCWAYLPSQNKWRVAREVTGVHEKAVTCIAGFRLSSCETLFASTSSDGTVRVWHASLPKEAGGALDITMIQSINVGTKVMVAVTLSSLPGSSTSFLMAMGGLDQQVHLCVGGLTEQFKPVCHLKGHQDWIRALDFSLPVKDESGLAVFLASSAQDRNIRMWKISAKKALENLAPTTQPSLKMYIEGPTFKADGSSWQVSLESLLVGHEDWVYSVQWQPPQSLDGDGTPSQSMRVLSASMDRTMMIWEPDPKSGIWMNIVTVGELGHTALGFYGGVWGPQGDAILAHRYSGSLHLWLEIGDDWKPQLVPSGHSAPVVDLSWGKLDRYLLSASHDQTTRLFACWERDGEEAEIRPSWHEIARPQVHGHDLNCLAVIKGPGNHRYVSGADEKVARVFEAPGAFLDSLYSFTATADADGFKREDVQIVGANMSALGLSQKPIYTQGPGAVRRDTGDAELSGDPMMEELPEARPMILTEPPLEEHLAHHTLWPESHKLYGHGNELFAMCGDPAGRLLATACKAQTTNVAEIWLWHINSWKVAGRLQSHLLTVTQLEFSPNSRFLLSVSRDRYFSVFHLTLPDTGEDEVQHNLLARVYAHKRIIWACSWSPCSQFFATGSRDRTVKIWEVSGSSEIRLLTTLSFKCSVTALAWAPSTSGLEELYILAIGKEDGSLELWRGNLTDGKKLDMVFASRVDMFLCHAATIHRLCWRRVPVDEEVKNSVEVGRLQLASCGADHTVRIYNVHLS